MFDLFYNFIIYLLFLFLADYIHTNVLTQMSQGKFMSSYFGLFLFNMYVFNV